MHRPLFTREIELCLSDNGNRALCFTCDGSGVVFVTELVKCAACEGTGKILGNVCPCCDGFGEQKISFDAICPVCENA
jgi:DnaJ-class molecular chaperone